MPIILKKYLTICGFVVKYFLFLSRDLAANGETGL